MSAILRVFEIISVVSITILPPLLDTGLQLWNGVTLNGMNLTTKNPAWSGGDAAVKQEPFLQIQGDLYSSQLAWDTLT